MNAHDRDIAKAPPANIEVEQALLGAVIVNNDAFHMVSGFLTERHFSEPIHAEIYRVMARAIGLGRKATVKTLAKSLPADVRIGELTPAQYIARLAADATTIINAPDYGRVIFDLALQRDLLLEARRVIERLGNGYAGEPVEAQIAAAEDGIAAIRGELRTTEEHSGSVGEAAERMLAEADRARSGKIVVPSSGLKEIDERLGGGCRPGRLIVIGGRPGMGKTALICAIARRLAMKGYGADIESLEVDDAELSARIMASHLAMTDTNMDYRDILTGRMSDRQAAIVRDALNHIRAMPINIDVIAGVGMAEIEARARMTQEQFRRRKTPLAAVFIDYLQLIRASERYRGSKVNELGEVVLGAKHMAGRLGVCVFLLAQLNREVEKRDDKRPMMSDLRDSGNIEEHADAVGLLYRPAYYLENSAKYLSGDPEALQKVLDCKHDLDVIFPKNRLGPTGVTHLWCDVAKCAVNDKSHGNYGAFR